MYACRKLEIVILNDRQMFYYLVGAISQGYSRKKWARERKITPHL
jgi:hypothetical protein